MLALWLLSIAPLVVPDGALVHVEQACYAMNRVRDGKPKQFGVTWQKIERNNVDGRDVLEVVVRQHAQDGSFDMRDEFMLHAGTLLPIHFRNTRDGKLFVELNYTKGHITGFRTQKDGSRSKVDLAVDHPVWEGDLYGVLFAALPLKKGGEYRIPYYQYDQGLGEFSIRVIGTELVDTPHGPVSAWALDAGPNEKQRIKYLIAKKPRRELGYQGKYVTQVLGGECKALKRVEEGAMNP